MDTLLSGSALTADLGSLLPDRADFLKSLSQQARLLTLVTPLPEASLLVEQMRGREAVSEDFCFEIQCLSASAHLELKTLIGEELTLRVLLADGRSTRSWHGIVTAASLLGSDGSLARYGLCLEPWTAGLAQRRNSRIFQDKSIEDVVREVFADYPAASWAFNLTDSLPVRALCTQYRETDKAFIERILASEGLSYRFEHAQGESVASEAGSHARHKLVIFDAGAESPPCSQPEIRFHRSNASESSDTIQSLQQQSQLASTLHVAASWDYRQLLATAASESIQPSAALPEMEDYDCQASAAFADTEAAERAVRLRARYAALSAKACRITGSVRVLDPGTHFTLTQHAGLSGDAAKLRVLMVRHEASNNLDAGARDAGGMRSQGRIERGIYRNQAVCVSLEVPLVPRPIGKPVAPGLQTALVLGGSDAAQDTASASERDGRVRIQFHWQRGARPNAGGLVNEAERATGELSNGIWVRVSEALAGPNWGAHFTPRVGSEVLVDFDSGDLDHPVIVGSLYNGQDSPPWPAGEESGANHAAVVSGLHATTLDGAGWNQWQIDDSTGQLRTRLASSAHASQLNLGHLIHHPATGGTRGAARGQGFELRTDGWQVQRAAKGMLLSASARAGATSTQLDASEVAAQLKAASDTAQRLSDAANQSEADALGQSGQVGAFHDLIHPEAPPADGSGTPERPLKSFAASALLAETPSSLVFATPASTTLFAGEQLLVVSQSDTHLTAQHTASLVSGEASSFYTHAGGIKAIAANAPLSIQAHDGPLEVLADQNVTITSSNDEIHVLANEKIVLQAGQSAITLEGANITFACPGKFTVKGGQNVLAGGAGGVANLGALPAGSMGAVSAEKIDEKEIAHWIELDYRDQVDGNGIANADYEIHFDGGPVLTGTLDALGQARREGVPGKKVKRVVYKPRKPDNEKPWAQLDELLG